MNHTWTKIETELRVLCPIHRHCHSDEGLQKSRIGLEMYQYIFQNAVTKYY